MKVEAEKTIICSITDPNKNKIKAIKKEYRNTQRYIRDEDADLYSATKQALDKYIEKDKLKEKEYPLFLRNDTFKVEKSKNTEMFDYWATIPIADIYGGVTVPIEPHTEIEENFEIHDSKIVKKGYGFELHLSASKTVRPKKEYRGIVGIDLGLNKLATCVTWSNR